MTSLKNMAAVEAEVKRGTAFLGHLCWYTIYNTNISRANLQDKFIDAKVDLRYMPNKIKPVDAFRRATAELEENRLPYGEKYQNFLIREVLCDKSSVVRQLIRETVDSKNVRLEYAKVGEITFYRDYEQIRVGDYGAGEKLAKVEDLFNEYKESYDGQHIRRVVRTILADMNPAAVRPSGGVYFVPQKYQGQLLALEKLVRSLDGEFFTMPVVDQEKSRDMLYRKFKEQVEQSIVQMKDVLQSGKTSKAEMVKIIDSSKKMFEQIKEYEELLNRNLADLKVGVDVLKEQIITLLDVA
jgi:hypothetical protein